MNSEINFLKRLKKIIPIHIKPKFQKDKDLLRWNQQQGKIFSQSIVRQNKAIKIKRMFNQSGIRELYRNCSFDNYKIEHAGHKKVLESTRNYANNFDNNISSFIFSGYPGTGKNHLASAIGNHLILNGKNVLIITVSDLMSNIKKTFHNSQNQLTEHNLLHNLSTVDLLMIDEIGIQIESRYEKIVINQIIDRRSSSKKSTGMLSNLNYNEMKNLLGIRVMDRMFLGSILWLDFLWKSYRNRI